MKFKVKLRLTDSGGTRKKYSINLEDGVKFMVGRGTPGLGSDLSHPSVSSQHCFLSVKDNLVWVTDNQSRNGTFLNQKKVDSASVRIGDMLQVGEYVIEFLEAPMPAKKEAGTQFLDIAELSAEEQEALKRVGAVPGKQPDATQVMNRSSLFSRSKSIDPEKLGQEEKSRNSVKSADFPSAESTPVPSSTPDSPASASDAVALAGTSSSLSLLNLASETGSPMGGLSERKTDEIDRPKSSAKTAAAPAIPETFIPQELMPTGMISVKRAAKGDLSEVSKKTGTRSEISAPFAKPGTPEPEELPAPPVPRTVSIPPAPSRRRKDDDNEPPSGAGSDSVDSVSASERKKELLSKHLKKPTAPETLAPSNKKNRTTDSKKPDSDEARPPETVAARVAKAPRDPNSKLNPHTYTSAGIAFASWAACGVAASLVGGGAFHFWIPLVFGILGAAIITGLAWLLTHYTEFMESDGDFRDYHRLLALASVPIVILGMYSHSSMLYRVPLYVIYGVIFFIVFMNRFKPLVERFVLVVGAYALALTFTYVATSWDVIMNGAAPAPAELAAGDANARAPAEVITNKVPPAPTEQTTQPQTAATNSAANAANDSAHAARPEADSFAMSELLTAAQQGDARIVRSLIQDKGVNPNTVAENGMTALMYAAYNGHLEVAKALTTTKADVNMRDRQGTSALMWAAYNGKRDMTAFLIQSGADLSAHRNDGDTALDIAKRWAHSDAPRGSERAEVVRLLENPGLARAMHVPSETAAAPSVPAAAPQTVHVTAPPTQKVATHHKSHRTPAAAAKSKHTRSHKKTTEKYPATTSDASDDDTDARARAVRSLKIGQ